MLEVKFLNKSFEFLLIELLTAIVGWIPVYLGYFYVKFDSYGEYQ